MKAFFSEIVIIFGFGIVSGIFSQEMFLKTNAFEISRKLESIIGVVMFSVGFIYPLFIFIITYIFLKLSTWVFLDLNISQLRRNTILALIPSFLFLLINTWLIIDIPGGELKSIILSNQGTIIPGIDLETSKEIANILLLTPFIVHFITLYRMKCPVLRVLASSFFPPAFILLISSLI